jgi:glycosyltransferase involved in cell wall biosynthesis
MKNILFYTEVSPFPTNGGERIRSFGLIKALSKSGYNIFAIINNEDNVNLKDYNLSNVSYMGYTRKKYSFLEKCFLSYLFRKNKIIISIFNGILQQNRIDLAFLDYAFVGQYISYFKQRGIPVILSTHNAQSNLRVQFVTVGIANKIRKQQQVFMEKRHERIFFRKVDSLIVVSKEDFFYHKKFVQENKIVVIPNFLDDSLYSISSYDKMNNIVMTANFNAFMNFEGIKWFLRYVWDDKLAKKTKLLLVGKGSKEIILKLGNYPSVEAIGTVDNVIPYIVNSKAVIIPLLHGSGSRLKCLEAMALKTQIIGTAKGVEGIECNSFIIADNPEDFRQKLNDLLDKPTEIDENAYAIFLQNYSLNKIIKSLKQLIDKF